MNDEDLLHDRDLPDESDMDDDAGDDSPDLVRCPYCRRPVYEQAELCPHCGSYISSEDSISPRPWWFVLGIIVCVLIVLGWVLW